MAEKIITSTLKSGLVLVRHYEDTKPGGADGQCLPVSYWESLDQQHVSPTYQEITRDGRAITLGGLGYYTNPTTGRNKVRQAIEAHVYSIGLYTTPAWPSDLKSFDCLPLPACRSRIRVWVDPSAPAYKLPAGFSHESGHALSNYCRVYGGADIPGFSADFRALWERAVSLSHTTFNGAAAPWDQPWGAGSRDEDGPEQIANAGRYFYGFGGTAGVSGPDNGGSDPVVPGFADPELHPEWGKMLRILPELRACVEALGYTTGSLAWVAGPTTDPQAGYWRFKDGRGRWIAQTDYDVWFNGETGAWVRFDPDYTLT